MATLSVGDASYEIFRLDDHDVRRLPYTLRILLENLLRNGEDTGPVANWDPHAEPSSEIAYRPARILLQDFTGVPAVVDLAAMRDGDRSRAHRHPDPAGGGGRRKVRRVLRPRARPAADRGPGDDREHVPRVRGDVRLLPRRRADARLPPPHGPAGGADRARRGLLQGERALARARRRADLFPGGRARPRRRRAEPRGAAAAAGPGTARRRKDVLPRSAGDVRRRVRGPRR